VTKVGSVFHTRASVTEISNGSRCLRLLSATRSSDLQCSRRPMSDKNSNQFTTLVLVGRRCCTDEVVRRSCVADAIQLLPGMYRLHSAPVRGGRGLQKTDLS